MFDRITAIKKKMKTVVLINCELSNRDWKKYKTNRKFKQVISELD